MRELRYVRLFFCTYWDEKNIIVTHQGPLEEVEVPDKVERVVDLPCLLVDQEILLRVNCKSPQNGKAAQYFFPPASLTIQ